MSDYVCRFCGHVVRGRARPPAYCPKCNLTFFVQLHASTEVGVPPPPSPSPAAPPSQPETAESVSQEPMDDSQLRRLLSSPTVKASRKERRAARRVQPSPPLELLLPRHVPIPVLDISTMGVLIEHESAFRFGETFDAEFRRAGRKVSLRAEVVRSAVSLVKSSSGSAIRYRTAFKFLDPPLPVLLALLPELPGKD